MALICCIVLPPVVQAQTSAVEQVLIKHLDRAFKPAGLLGLLDTRSLEKHTDGTYTRHVTTGDAIAKPTFATPLNTLRTACAASSGQLELLISAGRSQPDFKPVALDIGGERITVVRQDIWTWYSGYPGLGSVTASHGFAPLFATSHFAERATRAAEEDPPFGLFACGARTGATLWAAAVMPTGAPFAYDIGIRVTPVTAAWIRNHRSSVASEQAAREAAMKKAEEKKQARLLYQQQEAARLVPFRAGLEVGSKTNCGMVVALRGPLVQVQLPPNLTGPNGIREFWVKKEHLTDASPPNGCTFGG